MTSPPYDQRLARLLVRPLARIGVTPNQLTALSLLLALNGAWLFTRGEPTAAAWGAGLFVLARFLDHFDGELARLTGQSTAFGYYFDYAAGGLSYAALFFGIGVRFADGPVGDWAYVLGGAGALSALVAMALNLDLDRQSEMTGGETVGYPGALGFELEDGIYLLAPITWLGWLQPFFVAAGIGAVAYCVWTLGRLVAVRRGGAGRS